MPLIIKSFYFIVDILVRSSKFNTTHFLRVTGKENLSGFQTPPLGLIS